MLTDKAEAMRVAAVIAAAQFTVNAAASRSGNAPRFGDSAVDVLINVLREMEAKGLIAPGTVRLGAPAGSSRAGPPMDGT